VNIVVDVSAFPTGGGIFRFQPLVFRGVILSDSRRETLFNLRDIHWQTVFGQDQRDLYSFSDGCYCQYRYVHVLGDDS